MNVKDVPTVEGLTPDRSRFHQGAVFFLFLVAAMACVLFALGITPTPFGTFLLWVFAIVFGVLAIVAMVIPQSRLDLSRPISFTHMIHETGRKDTIVCSIDYHDPQTYEMVESIVVRFRIDVFEDRALPGLNIIGFLSAGEYNDMSCYVFHPVSDYEIRQARAKENVKQARPNPSPGMVGQEI